MAIVHTTHKVDGLDVILASRSELDDPYTQRLRSPEWRVDGHAIVARQLLAAGDYFLDLGANAGAFCLPVAVMTGASCLAVEALQSNVAVLQSAIEANHLSDRIQWVLAAIIEKDGEVRIRGESAYGTVADNGRRVLAYSLDGLMEDIGWKPISLVKLDIEGCEMRALAGAASFMTRNPLATFVFEANGAHCIANYHTPQDMIRFFEDTGRIVYLCRGGRLIRRTADSFQEAGLADYIASPAPLEDRIKGFRFDDFDEQTKIAQVVRTLRDMKPGYQKFMMAQMDYAPDFVKSDSSVRTLFAEMK